MNICLFNVKKNLETYLKGSRPILLAFSGGSDSLALLSLLHSLRKMISFDLHVAHIDHGWRKESGEQALKLEKMVKDLGYTFHLHTLTNHHEKRNLEETARLARFDFFKKIYKEIDAQSLLMAHQAEDLAETVLKRICEGASPIHLQGMKDVSELYGMQIWRPLLKVPKKEILAFLSEQSLEPIDDETNRDIYFLRARMRERIFPLFNQAFGKETTGNFVRLSDWAGDLKDYFSKVTKKFFDQRKENEGEISYDLNSFYPLEKIELSVFLTEALNKEGVLLSHEQKETAIHHLLSKSANKVVSQRERVVLVDRGFLLFRKNPALSIISTNDEFVLQEIKNK